MTDLRPASGCTQAERPTPPIKGHHIRTAKHSAAELLGWHARDRHGDGRRADETLGTGSSSPQEGEWRDRVKGVDGHGGAAATS